MEFSCDECFEMHQLHINECPNCGKNSYMTHVAGIGFVGECTECGYCIATGGGFPFPCREDPSDYFLAVMKPEKDKLVKLAKILGVNTVQLFRAFTDSNDRISVRYKAGELPLVCEQLTRIGIEWKRDPYFEKKYPHASKCPYCE